MNIKGFKVKPSKDGLWYATIIGTNGEPLFTSETHAEERSAIHACKLIDSDNRHPITIITKEGGMRIIKVGEAQ